MSSGLSFRTRLSIKHPGCFALTLHLQALPPPLPPPPPKTQARGAAGHALCKQHNKPSKLFTLRAVEHEQIDSLLASMPQDLDGAKALLADVKVRQQLC